MIAEVMGRDAGHLALHAGIAGGADAILIPELTPVVNEETIAHLCEKLASLREEKRKFALVVVAEGVKEGSTEAGKNIGNFVAKHIKAYSSRMCSLDRPEFCEMENVDTRVTVLGHLQRSGTPSSFDRLLATSFGIKAVDLIAAQQYDRLVVWQSGKVDSKPLETIIGLVRQCHEEGRCPSPVDPYGFMVGTARSLGIYIGDPQVSTPQTEYSENGKSATPEPELVSQT
jgi:6-phosphofructokinase 1